MKRLYNATDNLIEQQFYIQGSDRITGRTPDVSIKIRNSGLIVKKFKDLFLKNLKFFLEGEYLKFFHPFTQIKGIDENSTKEINQEVQIKLTALKDTNFDIVLLYVLVLSSLISRIRDIHFNLVLDEVLKRVEETSKNISRKQIQLELENLFMRNNSNISILYNISYLDALAESFNFKKVAHICKIQKSKYINKIVTLIISSTK
ncbi:MAG: hypothetical protein ACTSPN_13350 [Promethearchaeota archaeon]